MTVVYQQQVIDNRTESFGSRRTTDLLTLGLLQLKWLFVRPAPLKRRPLSQVFPRTYWLTHPRPLRVNELISSELLACFGNSLFSGKKSAARRSSGSTERCAGWWLPNRSSRGITLSLRGSVQTPRLPIGKFRHRRVESAVWAAPTHLRRHIFQLNIEPVKANLKLFAEQLARVTACFTKMSWLFCCEAMRTDHSDTSSGCIAEGSATGRKGAGDDYGGESSAVAWSWFRPMIFTSHLAPGGALNSGGGGADVTHKGFA